MSKESHRMNRFFLMRGLFDVWICSALALYFKHDIGKVQVLPWSTASRIQPARSRFDVLTSASPSSIADRCTVGFVLPRFALTAVRASEQGNRKSNIPRHRWHTAARSSSAYYVPHDDVGRTYMELRGESESCSISMRVALIKLCFWIQHL